jgi:hypothetical protein
MEMACDVVVLLHLDEFRINVLAYWHGEFASLSELASDWGLQ